MLSPHTISCRPIYKTEIIFYRNITLVVLTSHGIEMGCLWWKPTAVNKILENKLTHISLLRSILLIYLFIHLLIRIHCHYFYKPSGKNLLKAQAHVETAAGKKTANAGKVRSRDPLPFWLHSREWEICEESILVFILRPVHSFKMQVNQSHQCLPSKHIKQTYRNTGSPKSCCIVSKGWIPQIFYIEIPCESQQCSRYCFWLQKWLQSSLHFQAFHPGF